MITLPSLRPFNPNASVAYPSEDVTGEALTVRDDSDCVVFASVLASECAKYIAENSVNDNLRCITESGRIVSLLNVAF